MLRIIQYDKWRLLLATSKSSSPLLWKHSFRPSRLDVRQWRRYRIRTGSVPYGRPTIPRSQQVNDREQGTTESNHRVDEEDGYNATSPDITEIQGPTVHYYPSQDYYGHLKDLGEDIPSSERISRTTLQSITTGLINSGELDKWVDINPEQEGDIPNLTTLSSSEQVHLARSGYSFPDVMFWASILTDENLNNAAHKAFENTVISEAQAQNMWQKFKPVPTFVLISLIKKNPLPANAFRLLLISVWHHLFAVMRLRRRGLIDDNRHSAEVVSARLDGLVFTIFNVLLEQARRTFPEAIINIAAVFYSYVSWFSSKDHYPEGLDPTPVEESRLTYYYNRALTLLSQPTSLDPMKSSAVLERAQFDMLARMVQHRTPIDLNRNGWRAIISVLLRRPKSERDRKWAGLKSASWPPFKTSRIGLDEDLTPEDGASKAKEALTRMHEAGYSASNWERIASISSGWDTDQSPTIQRRTLLDSDRDSSDREVWAARVRVTRTLQEAWACFLSCEDKIRKPPAVVYEAMFEKIHYDALRHESEETLDPAKRGQSSSEGLPGDGKEVQATSLSPPEIIYSRQPPPSFESLFERMLADGIQPYGRLLATLLNGAPSFGMGVRIMQSCIQHYGGVIPKLLSRSLMPPDDFNKADVESHVLASVIKFLCMPSSKKELESLETSNTDDSIVSSWVSGEGGPMQHASRIIEEFRPLYRPCWNHLLSALAHVPLSVLSGKRSPLRSPYLERIQAAIMAQSIVTRMQTMRLELDFQGFFFLCLCMEKAVIGARMLFDGHDLSNSDVRSNTSPRTEDLNEAAIFSQEERFKRSQHPSALDESRALLAEGSQYLRRTFQELVGTATTEASTPLPITDVPPVPKLLATPSPAELHAYVRALGIFGDHEGILSLAQWMRLHHEDVTRSAKEELGGQRRMRSVLVAMCLFLEHPSREPKLKGLVSGLEAADVDLIELVAREVDSVEEWGGWPSHREVEEYCM